MNSSKKALDKSLKAMSFNPRQSGNLSTIVESNNPSYLIERAQEMLRESGRHEGIEKWALVRDAGAILAYAMTLLPLPPRVDGLESK